MDSRTRVLDAIAHEEADRVPIDYWAVPEVTRRLEEELDLPDEESLLRFLGADLRYVEGPAFIGQERHATGDGIVEDLWGVKRKVMVVDTEHGPYSYKHVVESPLAGARTVADIDCYAGWPSPDWWDYSEIAAQCERHEGAAVVLKGDRLDRTAQLKPMMYLRGMEQIYMDLATNARLVDAMVDRITSYYLEYNERVFRAVRGKADIFMMGDDFGTQHGPMMSPEMWRRFFRRGFRAHVELAHRYGFRVMHHSCGSVRYLLEEFIDAGLDILQALQPRAHDMDLETLKREYGAHITFQGSIDIQRTLPFGTPADVVEEVEQRMTAAKGGGGFIIGTAHNIQNDTPTENILALFDAYKTLGVY